MKPLEVVIKVCRTQGIAQDFLQITNFAMELHMRTVFHLFRFYRRRGASFQGALVEALRVYRDGF